jgi:hypothetical protein
MPRNRAWISKPEIAVLTLEPVLVEDVEARAESRKEAEVTQPVDLQPTEANTWVLREEEQVMPSTLQAPEASSAGPEARGSVAAPEAIAAAGSSEAVVDIR